MKARKPRAAVPGTAGGAVSRGLAPGHGRRVHVECHKSVTGRPQELAFSGGLRIVAAHQRGARQYSAKRRAELLDAAECPLVGGVEHVHPPPAQSEAEAAARLGLDQAVDRDDEARLAGRRHADERLAAERLGELDPAVDRPDQIGGIVPKPRVLGARADDDLARQVERTVDVEPEVRRKPVARFRHGARCPPV